MQITIYHNPRCSKSRQTLALLTEHGVEPRIVHYLDQPPQPAEMLRLANALREPVRSLLRENEDEFIAARDSLDLDDAPAVAAWLADHPRVLQRPIVIDEASGNAVMGRPPENVLGLLRSGN
ncbi:MAG: ArsC/Spx/MgsR family protein [Woeseiaceae bacterium]|nr:ArsC/Spx/MgsR family protein [Woeseiaceae bacterium]